MLLALIPPGLTGCLVLGQDYQKPAEIVPVAAWQAALPHGGSQEHMTDWWGQFGDKVLTTLMDSTLNHHPSLEAAWAAIDVARAGLASQQAGDRLHADGGGKASRSGDHRNSTNREMTTLGTVVDAGWEIDLFGRVKRATEEAQAKVAARQADWQGLRVSLAAEVATLYVEWRGCERLRESLSAEISSRQISVDTNEKAIQAGLVAPSEGELAHGGLADARAQLILQQASCDLVIKGLVALSGLGEVSLRQHLAASANQWPAVVPFRVTSVPAQLLSQRPDLASAEEELVAANAEVGVAEAGRYPRLSLLGSVGIGIGSVGNSTLNNQPWSFGPALSLPLWDGGLREAGVRSAKGRRQMALANYRLAVQNAVREVEVALVNLAGTKNRIQDTREAASRFSAYLTASQDNWRKGGISLLTLEEARRKSMGAERAVIQLERQEVQQWITLYKALGGGWSQTIKLGSTGEP
ncbi:MAG TPA: efflux transporter outer membrane subunit [Magnetococcales bacterium]|nr:efflux transporter outer membrane subunit [Magnetococcales bacterium]